MFSYVLRFVHNISIKIKLAQKYFGELTHEVVQKAIRTFIKLLQDKYFNENLNRKKLQSLNPFFDKENILRVGGRLGNATDISYDRQYPILIPHANHLDTT